MDGTGWHVMGWGAYLDTNNPGIFLPLEPTMGFSSSRLDLPNVLLAEGFRIGYKARVEDRIGIILYRVSGRQV